MATVQFRVPEDRGGDVHCNGWQQSGTIYKHLTPGQIVEVDTRDMRTFIDNGYQQVLGQS